MIKNLFLLHGLDNFRLRARQKFLRAGFLKKFPTGEIRDFSAENSVQQLETEILSIGLFSEKKLIFAENFWTAEKFTAAEKNKFFEKLENSENTNLFFVESALDLRTKFAKFFLKNAKTEIFEPLPKNEILRWICDFVQKNGGKISFSTAEFFLNFFGKIEWNLVRPDRSGKINWKKVEQDFGSAGENLWRFSSELQKLILLAGDEISENLIRENSPQSSRAIIWDFLENFSAKKKIAALENFQKLIKMGTSPHQICAMIFREMRIHAQIRAGISQNLPAAEIAAAAALHPFVLQKTRPKTEKNFPLEKIREIYDELFLLEQKLKTGKIKISAADTGAFELEIEKLILKI